MQMKWVSKVIFVTEIKIHTWGQAVSRTSKNWIHNGQKIKKSLIFLNLSKFNVPKLNLPNFNIPKLNSLDFNDLKLT